MWSPIVGPVPDDDRVFKALADPTRRFLLDRLFARDGRTLTELESELAMTRFGVMKHLRLLEAAGLVVTRRAGREKRHFLNPVPIRLIHDRWIDKYRERHVSALTALKHELEADDMTTATTTAAQKTVTTQVYRVFIKATPQAIWDALTKREWSEKYGYAAPFEYELRPGGAYKAFASEPMRAQGTPEVIIVGEVIECDPPKKLVQTWHPIWDPQSAAEPATRLTFEIDLEPSGLCRLTVTHDVTGAPLTAAMVAGDVPNAGGGWSWVLSDLKTLLETGKGMAG
jgi:DNA-binding transcriptional ArsR family regulator/uncharacterized protein YndB with AHSA1/START domain